MRPTDRAIQGFARYLATSGLKSTRQREEIARAFFAAGRHISAEELYHRIHSESPRIGLVTVYRTLKLLRQAGLATERQFGDAYARFDPHPADWVHHHLICTRCGRIQEFEDTSLQALRRRVARSTGFTVTDQKLELYGLCRACARLSPAAERRERPRLGPGAEGAL
jgi:Fur family ferric uptake transcriptional regulator